MSTALTEHHVPSQEPEEGLPQIQGYRLTRVIGHGGMSIVYLAEQASLEREVAIKVMLPEALADEVSRRRFENEARTIARLEHPHIVGIFEIGRTRDGLPYYAMPFLAHGHLGQREFVQDGEENGHARVRAILQALLAALDYAHARGVVHRDVKAENVLFDEAERPLLADFGIALRRFGPRVTTAGMAVGSTAYMAPEQARGEDVDARADLYAVGVLAWEMLTGQLPFLAGDALSMAVMHAQDPIPRLPRHLRHWQRFLDRALAKSPSQRYRSAQQMRDALERVPRRSGQALGRVTGTSHRAMAAIRRWPRTAWIGVVVLAAGATGLALRQGQPGPGTFFRATPGPAAESDPALPTPGAVPGASIIADPGSSMLRPLPISPAERYVIAAEQQLASRNLTAPEGANAFESILAAWKADPAYQLVPVVAGHLIDALGDEAQRHIRNGDDRRARDYVQQATALATQTRQAASPAMARFRARNRTALQARLDRAVEKLDRAGALQVVDSARTLGVDPATLSAMAAKAQRLPQPGSTIDDDGTRLARIDDRIIAVSQHDVSRGDYARFADATGREAALCRERVSLLRIVAPRSWKSPGFEQSTQHPVVCVSWEDAQAYARWLSQRTGRHYRLPTVTEARALPGTRGPKPVSEWLGNCGPDCSQRISAGHSWRGASGMRPLDSQRGYDDVGFRLVRDP
ncbi:bifunctional serine/threonine-protein kinase/formylglycine-generating enzyme family protein [Cognatiluteimonas telluris]|uniref:bifunctional serine/threonine-protein kinase/formylglycine-generating enzyme family protein n=1 Tax=Cognatiluteimonas telluris TaxID=1104775 RepID=UPI001A9CA0C4|nr:bifunctional serine/threonine-protein kinase/formylglycine-generating enzyme family protein [Lysobacter telluris]